MGMYSIKTSPKGYAATPLLCCLKPDSRNIFRFWAVSKNILEHLRTVQMLNKTAKLTGATQTAANDRPKRQEK